MRWGQVGRAAKARGVVISANFAVGLRAHPTFLTLVSPDQPNPSATLIAVIYGTIGRSSAPQSGAARTADLRDRVRQLMSPKARVDTERPDAGELLCPHSISQNFDEGLTVAL